MPFVKALKVAGLAPGQARCVTLAGERIAVFCNGGEFFALDDCCTHEEASLAEGTVLDAGGRCVVECPRHGSHFDLKTGAALTLPAVMPVKTYPVRVVGEDVEVDV